MCVIMKLTLPTRREMSKLQVLPNNRGIVLVIFYKLDGRIHFVLYIHRRLNIHGGV